MGNGFSDHWAQIVWSEVSQVNSIGPSRPDQAAAQLHAVDSVAGNIKARLA
jgi:hypothetical protein